MSITVVGSLNVDLVMSVDQLPRPGQTVLAPRVVSIPGGKGANQAAAAARLSNDVRMVGRVGDDAAGRTLVDDLAQRGVDVSGVLVTTGTVTGSATVVVDGAGENLIVVAPGANATLSESDVTVAVVREAGVVLLQLEVPLDVVIAAARAATGVVVLNPAPSAPLPAELLDLVDVLVPNEQELWALSGGSPSDDLATLARSITSRGGKTGAVDTVVTLGSRGVLVVPRSGSAVHIASPAVDVVDTTGAGDCFCAALGATLARGTALVAAARYASVAASLSTTAAGARGALPDDAQVLAALQTA